MSQPHNTYGLARKVGERCVPITEVGTAAPFAVTVLGGIVTHTVGDVEYMRNRHLRHAVGAVCRNVCNYDAVA